MFDAPSIAVVDRRNIAFNKCNQRSNETWCVKLDAQVNEDANHCMAPAPLPSIVYFHMQNNGPSLFSLIFSHTRHTPKVFSGYDMTYTSHDSIEVNEIVSVIAHPSNSPLRMSRLQTASIETVECRLIQLHSSTQCPYELISEMWIGANSIRWPRWHSAMHAYTLTTAAWMCRVCWLVTLDWVNDTRIKCIHIVHRNVQWLICVNELYYVYERVAWMMYYAVRY